MYGGENTTLMHLLVIQRQGPDPIMHKNGKCCLLWSTAVSLRDDYVSLKGVSYGPSNLWERAGEESL